MPRKRASPGAMARTEAWEIVRSRKLDASEIVVSPSWPQCDAEAPDAPAPRQRDTRTPTVFLSGAE